MDDKIEVNFRIKIRGIISDNIEKTVYYFRGKFDGNYTLSSALEKACLLLGLDFKNIDYPINYVVDSNLFELEYNFKKMRYEYSISFEDITLNNLDKQFHLANKIIKASCIFGGIGGDVGRCRGIHFFFHTNEKDLHHVPHIHCKHGSLEFRVNLKDLSIMDTKKIHDNRITSLAIKCIKINQKDLLRYWENTVVNGQSVKFKMYLPF